MSTDKPDEVIHVLSCPECEGDIDVSNHEIGTVIECPHCGNHFPVTRRFGDIELEREVGSGGMGSVFVGRDVKLDRTVAVKVLKKTLNQDEKFIQTFLSEARITASLNHPNIVQVYSFGEIDGQYYLVMEFIPGGSLDDEILENERVDELKAIEIGIGVAQGLEFAHQNGLIHRDIKPGNILFGTGNTPKVVDFGLSLSAGHTDLFEGEIWGTPYYVAPEKIEELPEDFRSDMYSLGATLFHAIAGRPPYEDESQERIVLMHVQGAPVSLSTFAPKTSKHTSLAIRKAMARNPSERYQSYGEMIEQLEDSKRRILDRSSPRQPDKNDYKVVSTDENSQVSTLLTLGAIIGIVVLLLLMYLTPELFNIKRPSALDDEPSQSEVNESGGTADR